MTFASELLKGQASARTNGDVYSDQWFPFVRRHSVHEDSTQIGDDLVLTLLCWTDERPRGFSPTHVLAFRNCETLDLAGGDLDQIQFLLGHRRRTRDRHTRKAGIYPRSRSRSIAQMPAAVTRIRHSSPADGFGRSRNARQPSASRTSARIAPAYRATESTFEPLRKPPRTSSNPRTREPENPDPPL
jgi:hypothetical protein